MPKHPKFGLIGAAGYVAPRHMAAIKSIGGDLIAACDPHDSVGILDSYFPNCQYYRDETEFFRACAGNVDYISICSPNYLHYDHTARATDIGIQVICEKPIALTHGLTKWLGMGDRDVWPILQCRLHPDVVAWQESNPPSDKRHKVIVEYITPRGQWYDKSWKGDPMKSGGLLMNIGIHLFDLCYYLFGDCRESVGTVGEHTASGILDMETAEVKWFLSIGREHERQRYFEINGEYLDLTAGFEDLHGEAYAKIIAGTSWGVEDAAPAIKICQDLNESR